MSNTFKVIDMITKEALSILHEKASFIGTTDRQYDDQFKSNGMGKKGSQLRVREPNEYEVTDGAVLDIQDTEETNQTITVATRKHVAMQFTSEELVQSVNNDAAFNDLSKNYIEPAVCKLISVIESDFIAYATKATANLVGTPGSSITDLSVPGLARAKLNQALAPMDGKRYLMTDSVTMSQMVNGMKGLFQDSAQVKEAMREGFYGRLAMADLYENERVWTLQNGADHTTVTVDDAAIADGDSTVVSSGGTVTVGSVFTFDGVYDIHPETKQSYPYLKQFVVTAVSGSAGSQTLTFWPALQSTGARKNVSALPANTAAMTFIGAASTNYVQSLMYHKNAYQFITADLPLFAEANKCARRVKDGVSLRCWQDSDIINDRLIVRMDILYGFAALRPNWGCRLIGAANA
jgi:hypothetical protein